jgi:C1A family cysteine protease
VYDQGQLGSCTGNAIAAAYEFDVKKQGKKDFLPSRLFIYYNERLMENTIQSDAGAEIRDGIKSIAQYGVCPESYWPYDIRKFANKPPKTAYKSALLHQAVTYRRVSQTVADLKACLASGIPVVIGFSVYESFESDEVARTGVLNMPAPGEQLLGGHAVLVVGYDDATGRWLVRNSWGSGWAQAGYFTMPYAYLTDSDLAADFWAVQTVEG